MMFSMDGHGSGTLRETLDRRPDGISVRLAGEMDIATAPQLPETVRSLSGPEMQHVRLDLSGLTFIDASGLAALVQVRTLVHRAGGRLTLHGARPLLCRMLAVTNLSSEFDLESSPATLSDR